MESAFWYIDKLGNIMETNRPYSQRELDKDHFLDPDLVFSYAEHGSPIQFLPTSEARPFGDPTQLLKDRGLYDQVMANRAALKKPKKRAEYRGPGR